MIVLEDWEVTATLCDPEALYKATTSHETYLPSPRELEADCEFVVSDISVNGRLACFMIVHQRRVAFLTLFTSEDLEGLRARFAELQLGLEKMQVAQTGNIQ